MGLLKEIKYYKVKHSGVPTKEELLEAKKLSRINNCTVVLQYIIANSTKSNIEISENTNIDIIDKDFDNLRIAYQNNIIIE